MAGESCERREGRKYARSDPGVASSKQLAEKTISATRVCVTISREVEPEGGENK